MTPRTAKRSQGCTWRWSGRCRGLARVAGVVTGLAVCVAAAASPQAVLGTPPRGVVTLTAPVGREGVPVSDAIKQVSEQTGLTLLSADTPQTRQATVKPGEQMLRVALARIGSVIQAKVTWQGERGVAFVPRPRGYSDLWDRLFMEWDDFERDFRYPRRSLGTLAALTPDDRWRLLGEGQQLALAALSPPQRGALAAAIPEWQRDEWPTAALDQAVLTGHWQVAVQLRGRDGNFSTLLRDGLVEQRPPDETVTEALEELLHICDGVLTSPIPRLCSPRTGPKLGPVGAGQSEAEATTGRSDSPQQGPLRVLLESGRSYRLDQVAAVMTQQTGLECYVDARLESQQVLAIGPDEPVDLGTIEAGLAAVADGFWRSVGPVEVMCPQVPPEDDCRLRALWALRLPTHRAFDEQFLRLARLWTPGFLRLFSDSRLIAGLIPYLKSPRHEPRWRTVVQQLKGELGKPIPDEVLARIDGGEPAAVSVEPQLVLSIERGGEKPVLIGASPFQDDFQERDKFWGRE